MFKVTNHNSAGDGGNDGKGHTFWSDVNVISLMNVGYTGV